MRLNPDNRAFLASKLAEYAARLATQESKPTEKRLTKPAIVIVEHRMRIIKTLLDKGGVDRKTMLEQYRQEAGKNLGSLVDAQFEDGIWSIVKRYNEAGGKNLS